MKKTVSMLKPGDAFRIDLGPHKPMDCRLIYVNFCRAYVEPLRHGRVDILEDSPGGRINISPNCECDKIDEELENIMKSGTTATGSTATKTNRIAKGADRKFDPKKQERPVREGTIRAKLLAALESGKTDVNKLMKEFNMSRSLLIAHTHEMHKCHGYGYSVVGDVLKIVKPVGGVMKAAAAPAKKTKTTTKSKAAVDPFDDEEEDLLS